MSEYQKHHIVPNYICKKLKLTTSYKVDNIEFYFKENIVKVTLEQHAKIHWGYYTGNLEPLLEVCNPSKEILDMIEFGNMHDSHAAGMLGSNFIDGYEPVRGKKCPDYKVVLDIHGNEIEGSENWSEKKRYRARKASEKGIEYKSHEEKRIEREIKEREKKERKILDRLVKQTHRTKEQLIAKEKRIKVKSVKSLEYYHKQRAKGIDPNKKSRDKNKESRRVYANWYYWNVQKPKNKRKNSNG